jgi:hypothetical protein
MKAGKLPHSKPGFAGLLSNAVAGLPNADAPNALLE